LAWVCFLDDIGKKKKGGGPRRTVSHGTRVAQGYRGERGAGLASVEKKGKCILKKLSTGFGAELVVEDQVMVEIKASVRIQDGITRIVNGLRE
jgi:hypothetical protein